MNNEQPTINGDGKQSRDFTYIEMQLRRTLRLAEASSEVAGQAFNIYLARIDLVILSIAMRILVRLGKCWGMTRIGALDGGLGRR